MPGDSSYMYILHDDITLFRRQSGEHVSMCCELSYNLSRMAKHAAEAFSDILRLEMGRFGVRVIIVEPGNFGAATDGLNVSYYACHPILYVL